MNANIFKYEFRARLQSVLTWSLSATALLVVYFFFFTTFADQAALLNEMMERFPAELRAAFGLDRMDLSTVLGYFSFLFLFIQLILAIQAATYGVGLVSIEESELTADFLLSKPVSRAQVLTSKLVAALSALVITALVVWVASFVVIESFRGGRAYDQRVLVLLLASILIFQLSFLSVGLLISLVVRRVRSVTPYALGMAFGAYVLSGFSGVFGDVTLELVTPFKHLDAAAIVKDGAYNTPLVLLNLAISGVSLALSYWLYLRRDIHSVS